MLDKHIVLEALQNLYNDTLKNSKNNTQEFHTVYPQLKTDNERERFIKEHHELQTRYHTKAQKINKNLKYVEEMY